MAAVTFRRRSTQTPRNLLGRSRSKINVFSLEIFLMVLIGCCMVQSIVGIYCFECSDARLNNTYYIHYKQAKRGQTSASQAYTPPFGTTYQLVGHCGSMHPTYAKTMKCASNHDICTRTTVFGARGKNTSIVTRECSSLSYYFRHNPDLNATGNFTVNKCYTEKEFRSPSPPYKHEFCICQSNFCNAGTHVGQISDYQTRTIIIVSAFHVALNIMEFPPLLYISNILC